MEKLLNFKNNKKYILVALTVISVFIAFSAIQAQTPIMESSELKEGYEDGSYDLDDFIKILIVAAKIIWAISGSLALIAFVYGGVVLLVSSGSSQLVEKGRQSIIGGAIGLAIVFGSYLAVNFIITDVLQVPGFKFNSGWFQK